jgi:hypothetical protein
MGSALISSFQGHLLPHDLIPLHQAPPLKGSVTSQHYHPVMVVSLNKVQCKHIWKCRNETPCIANIC